MSANWNDILSGAEEQKKLDEFLEHVLKCAKEIAGANDDGGVEQYVNYDEQIETSTIKSLLKHDRPLDAFHDLLNEWAENSFLDYEIDNILKDLYRDSSLSDKEKEMLDEYQDDVVDAISQNIYGYYDVNDWNREVKVNIALDTGNVNYDCSCDNVLNYASPEYDDAKEQIDKNSSLFWVAQQQGKGNELIKEVQRYLDADDVYEDSKDKFICSCIDEWLNATSSLTSMTFLVSMKLLDFLELRQAFNMEEKLNGSYHMEERKGNGYIVLDKGVMCGLYDSWNGGGSVLEVALDKDIKIPLNAIFYITVDDCKEHGYDVDDVYGLVDSAWSDSFKAHHYMTEEEIENMVKEMEESKNVPAYSRF